MNTFSVRFDEAGYDESNKTELMKNYLKTNHLNVTISKKSFLTILKILSSKGCPNIDSPRIPTLRIDQTNEGKVKVVLSGEGADELFGGYSRVQKSPFDFKKENFLDLCQT